MFICSENDARIIIIIVISDCENTEVLFSLLFNFRIMFSEPNYLYNMINDIFKC